MSAELDVVVVGFDVETRVAENGLMRVFGLEAPRARRFVEQAPVIAKRCSDHGAAERYAEALRSIGARVEVRIHGASFGASAPPVVVSSLPAPPPEVAARLRESLRVARAADSAIARFRQDEGLDAYDELGFDPYDPAIPKAPKVPHDLAKMPNAALPRRSDRPEWVVSDQLSLTPGAGGEDPEGLRSHTDAQLPPRGRPSMDSGMRRRPVPESVRPVGLAHAATASGRPGLSARSLASEAPLVPWPRQLLRYWPFVLIAIVGALAAARVGGVLATDAERRRETWKEAGITADEHQELGAFLARPQNQVQGIARAQAQKLLEQLKRAGVTRSYAIRIEEGDHGARAWALLVEMPLDRSARQTVHFHVANAQGRGDEPTQDRGEPYLAISFGPKP